MTTAPRDGGCACGAVRYRLSGELRRTTHCHCVDCRRSGGAAFVTWSEVERDSLAWLSGTPRSWNSRPGATRTYCGDCGSPLTFEDETDPAAIDVTVATLDDPDSVTPDDEVWTDRALTWSALLDSVPRYGRGRRDAEPEWHLYVVRTEDDRLYAGIATDVDRRYEEHRAGGRRAAKYLKAHRPASIAWRRRIGPKALALKAEHRFKQLSRTEKDALIEAAWTHVDPETGSWSAEDLRFRDATLDDLPRLIAWLADDPLGAKREAASDDDATVDPRYTRAFVEIEADPNHTILLAVDPHGTPLGCLQWSLLPNLTYAGGRRAQIEGVRVDPSARGRGIGSALVEEAVRRAREAGCVLIQLTTDRRRPDAARFYAAAGFRATHHGMKRRLVGDASDVV